MSSSAAIQRPQRAHTRTISASTSIGGGPARAPSSIGTAPTFLEEIKRLPELVLGLVLLDVKEDVQEARVDAALDDEVEGIGPAVEGVARGEKGKEVERISQGVAIPV